MERTNAVEMLSSLYQCAVEKADSNKKEFLARKLQHSFDTENIGAIIVENISDNARIALLLHDIGYFVQDSVEHHAQYGFEYLKGHGNGEMDILLPILLHENDLDWKQLLKKSPFYTLADEADKHRIKSICMLVRDADIISNMEILTAPQTSNDVFSENLDLITHLEYGRLPIDNYIMSLGDNILYLLCGIRLLCFPRSFDYIREQQLIDKLMAVLRFNGYSELVVKRIRDAIHEKYNL